MNFFPKIAPRCRREILHRANLHRQETRLVVDYYRIRQRFSFPLPVEDFPENLSTVRGLPDYPYAIWLLWRLEERITTMGWAAEWDGEKIGAQRDLQALVNWTRFRQGTGPDLCAAHIARIFVTALGWKWLPPDLRQGIRYALRRLVNDGFARRPELPSDSARKLVKLGVRFPNIPTIGALGLAIAAAAACPFFAKRTAARATVMAELWLNWGALGHGEGVSYDGYTCDFIMDWVIQAPLAVSEKLLSHPRLRQVLEEIRHLGAPGRPENLALLGDVEPAEMRFHYSFAAKYLTLTESREKFPFPSRPEKFLRADALHWLSPAPFRPVRSATVHDAHYALVLQSARPVKVVVSWNNSRMGHMQPDHGSVVVGVGTDWLVDDPGYRQYLPTSEKSFTLGPCAHNHPVINGEAPSQAPDDRRYDVLKTAAENGVRLNLGPTYARWKGTCFREIRLDKDGHLMVQDEFRGEPIRRIDYHWHGQPTAAWHHADGWAFLQGETNNRLRFTCEGHPLQPQELHRLPGSRGHLTVVKSLRFPKPRKTLRVRWLFEISPAPAPANPTPDGGAANQTTSFPPADEWKTVPPARVRL